MKKYTYFFFLILNFCTSQEQKINGISFVASDRFVSKNDIEPIVDINANWVTLMPFAFMKSESDTTFVFNHERQWINEKKEGVENTTQLFKNEKIKVMLKPQIWIPRGGFTGHIEMNTENEWLILEKNYSAFILYYAQIAQNINCELFCIGTEMNLFVTKRPKFWQNLISKIKTIYKGKITYAENWDTYKNVSFLNELDYIGIDAYFPLDSSKTPTIEAIEKAWQPIQKEIKTLSEKYNKKVIFTEYGYQSRDYTTLEPWNHSKENNVNLEAQSNALQALYNVFWNEDWFAGGFLWKWFDDHEKQGGIKDNDYTVQNKPALETVKKAYSKN